MKYFRELKIISRTIVWYQQAKIFIYSFWTMTFLFVSDKMDYGVGGKG